MKYLHTMVRVSDLEASLEFYCDKLGLAEASRTENPGGRFTLVFLCAPGDEAAAKANKAPMVELVAKLRDPEAYEALATTLVLTHAVDDIYALCQRLKDKGVVINRPPRDGRMAFVRSPDNISIELLQAGPALPPAEPWASMPNVGVW